MPLRYTVLASGSSGNASLLEVGGFGLLIDAGLGPRQFTQRLASGQASWERVDAVLLTHTHSDHWKEATLAYLHRRRIPLYCHQRHHDHLLRISSAVQNLTASGLIRLYTSDQEPELAPGLRCRPLAVSHDDPATFGFRFEITDPRYSRPYAIGYAADLGCWDADLVTALSDVDLLALEFNHDVAMERSSGRDPQLIFRVLGDQGHLSNDQAAALLGAVLERSTAGRLRHLVQLHLSRQCNYPSLAREAARMRLSNCQPAVTIHTARQDVPLPPLVLCHPGGREPAVALPRPHPVRSRRPTASAGPMLPGMEYLDQT